MPYDPEQVTYGLTAEAEDFPFEGNVLASGDDALDAEAEQWVREQLDAGNEWAWCVAVVTARYPGLPIEGRAVVGGCSYRSAEEFRQDGYYADMCQEAREDLEQQIREIQEAIG